MIAATNTAPTMVATASAVSEVAVPMMIEAFVGLKHLRSAFGKNGNDIHEGKVALQDITRKYKEMNCVDKENCKEMNCVDKENLVWNSDLIETVEFENLVSQTAQGDDVQWMKYTLP